jgi:hypothetical protein
MLGRKDGVPKAQQHSMYPQTKENPDHEACSARVGELIMSMEYKEELETGVPSVQLFNHFFPSQHCHPDQSNGNILIFQPLHLPVQARFGLSVVPCPSRCHCRRLPLWHCL